MTNPAVRRTSRWIDTWEPEHPDFWESTGTHVARRNLIWSILAEHLGFSVWILWSIVVVYLPAAGFDFSVDQRFWLVAVPNLVGATMRFPYTFAVPRFGGRNWTAVSALLLLLPLILLTWCVTHPGTPYWAFLLAAATAGLGGGNFASSMANISFFYPDKAKGLALGLNAAGGNIGVSTVQLLVPVLVGLSIVGGTAPHLENIALVWGPLAVLSAVLAWTRMDNLGTATSTVADQLAAAKRGQTWVMAVLYVGTFGSFIGFSGALPLLITTQFPERNGLVYAFLGALVGSSARPAGGWLADRLGGARVTAVTFVLMGVGTLGVVLAVRAHNFVLFLMAFLVLFVLTGLGNGSTYRMIPAIFRTLEGASPERPEAMARARTQAAAALGIISAVGAYGGFFVPRALGMSMSLTGSIESALLAFIAFYALCVGITWTFYLRRVRVATRIPTLAHAHI